MADNFKIGDIVRKLNGSRHIRIDHIYSTTIYGTYLHNGKSAGRIYISNLIKVEEETEKKGNPGMKGKLFKIKADDSYGIGLAVDSTGQYVLEMKDGSGVRSFNKKDVEVVMPFTFTVQYNGSTTEHSYLGKEGSVAVNDILLKTDGTKGITIAKVTAINTKSEKAAKYFDGVKISTVPLETE